VSRADPIRPPSKPAIDAARSVFVRPQVIKKKLVPPAVKPESGIMSHGEKNLWSL